MVEDKINYVTIKGKDYLINKELIINNIKYLYLISNDEANEILIQKVILENNQEYLTNLDNEDEVKMAITEFQKSID